MHKNLSGVTFPLLGSLTVSGILIFSHNQVLAQVTPDNTLGNESSVVNTRDATSDSIDGGAIRGQNLFHSFEEFNVDAGRGVYFANPEAVNNIFSRVTGNDVSNILGTLGVDGAANLFLINPNGIIFGEDASLDVNGSFAATTADGIEFGEQGFFSASNPESPKLLTINPSAYLFNQISPGAISNNSRANDNIGLQVQSGKSLSLIGGDVSLNGGNIKAPAGNVQLGGLSTVGTIDIDSSGSLSFPEGLARGNVSLGNGALVDVTGTRGGDIDLTAKNINIVGKSSLVGGTFESVGLLNSQSGDINLDATDTISLDTSPENTNTIDNEVQIGNAGNINIKARLLDLTNGAVINNSTSGVGNAGKINITTGSLSATNGSQINSFTRGKGNAGDITIQATDAVTFDGIDSNDNYSGSASNVGAGAVGDGGNIKITASSLSLTNGGYLTASVLNAFDNLPGGEGQGGNININVNDTLKIADGNRPGIFASLGTGADGSAGNIDIQAGNLVVKNGGEITSSTFGKGDSGNIAITADNSISLDASDILNNVQSKDAVGDAGKIDITTGSLSTTNGSQINSFTRGQGNAGDITIQATAPVTFDGVDSNDNYSGLASSVEAGGVGNGGNLNITSRSLALTNGGYLSASVSDASDSLPGGKGQGGNININVNDTLKIADRNRPGIFASLGTGADGSAGNIDIQAGNLVVKNGGEITSSTFGQGDSGDISITTDNSISLDSSSYILNNVQSIDAVGDAGKINITTGSLSATNGSQINSFTSGKGNAGDITIQATDAVTFDGIDSNDNYSDSASNVGAGAVGDGGNIKITASSLALTNGGYLSASVSDASDSLPGGKGQGGNININVNDTLKIADGNRPGIFASLGTGADGSAGNIDIQAGNLVVKNGGEITSSTFGQGDSGDISITTDNSISLDSSSYILNNVQSIDAVGDAGKINITTGSLSATNGSQINSFTRGKGNAGNITIEATDAVTFDGFDSNEFPSGLNTKVEDGAVGDGGNISLTSENIRLRDDSDIRTDVFNGTGDGGNINITADSIIAFDDSDIFAFAADGQGGNITLDTPAYFAENFTLNSLTSNPDNLENNSRADLNATGAVSGVVSIPDVSFIQNSLNNLPDNSINTDELVANSCVSPVGKRQEGKFIITGTGGLPDRPGNGSISDFATGEVRNVPSNNSGWHRGEPIIEPQGVYRLTNGKLVMSRECHSQ